MDWLLQFPRKAFWFVHIKDYHDATIAPSKEANRMPVAQPFSQSASNTLDPSQ
jgi:hypothetical protein